MKQHEDYLQPFNDLFKFVDQDNDGILSIGEFKHLISLMEFREVSPKQTSVILNDQSILKLIAQMDPYNHKHITYGQILYVLANVSGIFLISLYSHTHMIEALISSVVD